MSQYRLHIDIPLNTDGKVPTEVVEKIMTVFDKSNFCVEGIQCVNYRLGHDDEFVGYCLAPVLCATLLTTFIVWYVKDNS